MHPHPTDYLHAVRQYEYAWPRPIPTLLVLDGEQTSFTAENRRDLDHSDGVILLIINT